MTKKEKLEYFKLIEPKLRELYFKRELKDSDFEKLNIKNKDIELFYQVYGESWSDSNILNTILKNDEYSEMFEEFPISLEFPEDSFFYQFGVSNINIELFKYYLQCRERLMYIDKTTGNIEVLNSEQLIGTTDNKDIQNRINLVIENPITFLQDLKAGRIDEILAVSQLNSNFIELPKESSLFKITNNLNLNDFIDILGSNKHWITYDKELDIFVAYGSYDILKLNIETIYKFNPNADLNSKFFFKIQNPLKMRYELMNDNTKVLNEIKEVNICTIFKPNKIEG
jgi:hypothetical protein